jgi:DNA-binding MarR family transcriptional regulator/GNAT superfamily N-acetyltransferase
MRELAKPRVRGNGPTRAAWEQLLRLFTDMDARGDRLLKQIGLTAGDSRVLTSLDNQSAHSIGSLAHRWRCDVSTATRAVDRLEERGLVERRSKDGDRRVRLVALTPQGGRVKAKLTAGRLRPPSELAALSAAEVSALMRALRPVRGTAEAPLRHWARPRPGLEIRPLGPGDGGHVLAAAGLFRSRPLREATERSLLETGHHLLIAYQDAAPAGFIEGIEQTQPDKGTEMFIAELVVDQKWRGRGIGRQLVEGLTAIARDRRCYGMWALSDAKNAGALGTYERTGGSRKPGQVMVSWEFD